MFQLSGVPLLQTTKLCWFSKKLCQQLVILIIMSLNSHLLNKNILGKMHFNVELIIDHAVVEKRIKTSVGM